MILPGLTNPYVLLAAVLVLGGTNAYTWYATKENTTTVVNAKWNVRELKIAEANRIELARVNGLVLDAQRAHARDLQQASIDYQARLQEHNEKADAALAAHRDGTRRLSISAKCPATGINTVPGTNPSPGGRVEESRAELSDDAVGFLIGQAKRCDDLASQLTTAQAIMALDRKLIQGFNLKLKGEH